MRNPASVWKESDPIVKRFKQEIHDRAKEIDPANEHDWLSLTLGWAIGKGLSVADALDLALFIRYDTNLG